MRAAENLVIASLLVAFAVPCVEGSGVADERRARQLVTFVEDGREVSGLWLHRWDDTERATVLVLRPESGRALRFEQVFTLLPTAGDRAELRFAGSDWWVRLEIAYPGIVATSFGEAIARTEPGEAMELRLSLADGRDWEGVFSVEEDQLAGIVGGLTTLVRPEELLAGIPSDLRASFQLLAEIVGPWDAVEYDEAPEVAIGWPLTAWVGAALRAAEGSPPGKPWTAVKEPVRSGIDYSEEELGLLEAVEGLVSPRG